MYEEFTRNRITQLRMQKGVSARDMSLSLGQNDSYINRIENKKSLPSLSGFFYICEYLGITPKDFFDTETENPTKARELLAVAKGLRKYDNAAMEALAFEILNEICYP